MRYAINYQIVAWRIVVPDPTEVNKIGGNVALAAFIDVLYERIRERLFTTHQNSYPFHDSPVFLQDFVSGHRHDAISHNVPGSCGTHLIITANKCRIGSYADYDLSRRVVNSEDLETFPCRFFERRSYSFRESKTVTAAGCKETQKKIGSER
jgi:hypothetical protein